MRRVWFLSAPLLLALAGCPGETSVPLPPTSQPVAPPPVAAQGGGEEGVAPTASPAAPAAAAEPDMMDELAKLGPRMTFDLRPKFKVKEGDIELVLERLAMLRRDEEHLAKEPWQATSEAAPEGHYLAIELSVRVGGVPWSELPPGQQVGALGPLVLEFEGEPVYMETALFEPIEGRPESAYHYRRFVPPAHKDGKLVLALGIEMEGKEPISIKFPPLSPLRPAANVQPPEEMAPEEKAPEEKPPEEKLPEGEHGDEEH